jgi:hypothetical protein
MGYTRLNWRKSVAGNIYVCKVILQLSFSTIFKENYNHVDSWMKYSGYGTLVCQDHIARIQENRDGPSSWWFAQKSYTLDLFLRYFPFHFNSYRVIFGRQKMTQTALKRSQMWIFKTPDSLASSWVTALNSKSCGHFWGTTSFNGFLSFQCVFP